jgi:hypothetical protein
VAVVRFRPRRFARRAGATPPFFFAVFLVARVFVAFAFVVLVRLRFGFGLRLLIMSPPRGSARLRLSYAAI